jgi:hypothetical protein
MSPQRTAYRSSGYQLSIPRLWDGSWSLVSEKVKEKDQNKR